MTKGKKSREDKERDNKIARRENGVHWRKARKGISGVRGTLKKGQRGQGEETNEGRMKMGV